MNINIFEQKISFGWRTGLFCFVAAVIVMFTLLTLFGRPLRPVRTYQPETPEQVMRALEALEVKETNPVSMQLLTSTELASRAGLAFYADAHPGDWVIRFATKVILYRPSDNQIVRNWDVGRIPEQVLAPAS